MIEYKQVVFGAGTKAQRSPYQGSGEEVDKVWDELYNGKEDCLSKLSHILTTALELGLSQISTEEASQLPNATMLLQSDPSLYVVQLDVFHQLHCLNLMRKLAYPETYPTDLTLGSDEAQDNLVHLEHCYDQLRQSLQCHSDVATIYWGWVPEVNKAYGNLATTHTCKDYEKVKEWARDHQIQGECQAPERLDYPDSGPCSQRSSSQARAATLKSRT